MGAGAHAGGLAPDRRGQRIPRRFGRHRPAFGGGGCSGASAGFGAACFRGLETATSEVVCFMDCDGSLDPRELPTVAAPVIGGETPLVLGRRQSSAGAWPLHARVANFVLCAELARRTGIHLRDLGPMRAAPRARLVDLALTDRRSGWPLEMVLRAHAAGWRLAEVPVAYLPRSGRSKVTGTVRGTLQAVHDMASVLR